MQTAERLAGTPTAAEPPSAAYGAPLLVHGRIPVRRDAGSGRTRHCVDRPPSTLRRQPVRVPHPHPGIRANGFHWPTVAVVQQPSSRIVCGIARPGDDPVAVEEHIPGVGLPIGTNRQEHDADARGGGRGGHAPPAVVGTPALPCLRGGRSGSDRSVGAVLARRTSSVAWSNAEPLPASTACFASERLPRGWQHRRRPD